MNDAAGPDGDLEALAQRLKRPPSSLRAFAGLDAAEHAALRAALDAALVQRRSLLDQALRRVLPWPLRDWLRR